MEMMWRWLGGRARRLSPDRAVLIVYSEADGSLREVIVSKNVFTVSREIPRSFCEPEGKHVHHNMLVDTRGWYDMTGGYGNIS